MDERAIETLTDWLAADRAGAAAAQAGPGNSLASAANRPACEDRAVLASLPGGRVCALMADGMGGMEHGADCAALAVAACLASLAAGGSPETALRQANRLVHARHGGRGGTTLTAIVVAPDGSARLAHAGDTRAYALSETAPARLLSTDHTALAELGPRGAILPPRERAVRGSQLTRAVGISPEVGCVCQSVNGEAFLLTSDGVHDFAGRAVESLRIGRYPPPDALARLLQVSLEAGSRDDRSALWFAPAALPAAPADTLIVWEAYRGEYQLPAKGFIG